MLPPISSMVLFSFFLWKKIKDQTFHALLLLLAQLVHSISELDSLQLVVVNFFIIIHCFVVFDLFVDAK